VDETVSVVVTAWRRREFLGEAIASVRFAVGSPFELVVAADFHDDDLEREVRERRGTWIVSRERHWGAMVGDGIRAARGSVIALLDDDDLFHPVRLEEVRRAFEEDPELGFFHNAHVTFRNGKPPSFSAASQRADWIRIPPGRRTSSDCELFWTKGAGYNGSSVAVRRSLIESDIDQLRAVRKAIPPYLFYRAWCSSVALVIDSRRLTAVRLHSTNTTPNPLQGRRDRFARLASIAADLSADAEAILLLLPSDVWDVPLRQMSSMGEILAAVNNGGGSSRHLADAALELLRRRRIWLPRWTLISLALARIGSRRGARALFNWLTAPGTSNAWTGVEILCEQRKQEDQYPREYLEVIRELARTSAKVIVPIVIDLVDPKSVVDFGCGTGSWLAVFRELGVLEVLGIDGDWIARETLEIPRDCFLVLDLERPVILERGFDLVLALEVAEHLSRDSANTLVESLTEAGSVVLFSAAIPFQGGPHHVNEQWPEYWVEKFRARGFSVIDCIRRRIWNDPRVAWFYAQNTLLFVRGDAIEKNASLNREWKRASDLPLSLVHPLKYTQIADPSNHPPSKIFWDAVNWLKRRGLRGS